MMTYIENSNLARACYIPFILIWMIIRVYRPNYRSSFSPLVFARLDPRSLFTYSLIFSLLTQLCHDILIYYLKYREGYVYARDLTRPVNQTSPKIFYYDNTNINYEDDAVIENPISKWNKQDLDYSEAAHYLNAASLGFMLTCLFVLQAYWSIIMEQISRRKFTSVFEYWIYLVVAILVLPIFPILAFVFNSDSNVQYEESFFQFIFSIIVLLLCLLSIRTQFGITTLITSPTRCTILTQNCDQLKIFQDFNLWLICSLFIWNAASLLLSIDTIFMQPNGISRNINYLKFITDFLLVNSNFGRFITYIILILIVYPDFNVGPVKAGVVSLQRTISSPYNVTKPKTFNYDIDNLHELSHHHTAIDISNNNNNNNNDNNDDDDDDQEFDCSSSSCSDDDTSSRNSHTKSFHSKHSTTSTSHLRHSSLKRKGSNKLKSHRTSNGKIAKNNIEKRKNKEMKALPTNEILSSPIPMTLMGNNAIGEILEQHIMVETRQDVVVEPAYMHAYINPHIPSPRYERSPINGGGSRTDSVATDLLLAPLPSPYSEFAVTSTRLIGKRNSFNKQQSSLRGNGTPDTNRNSISSYENNNKSITTDDGFNDKNEQIITTDNVRRAIGSGLRNSVVSSYDGDLSGISEDEIIRSGGGDEKRIERRSSRKKQTKPKTNNVLRYQNP